MAQQKKQGITTGNGLSGEKTPILASESVSDHTAGQLEQSQTSTSIADGSTKPLSLAEALSLLQTISLDFRALDCQTVILARRNVLTLGIKVPASIELSVMNGHIQIDGVPVSNIESNP